ncbi:MAG: type II toxin-antitoxin system HicB family antitoxin [Tepidisphaeraceae bacterium]
MKIKKLKLTAVFERDGKFWMGYVQELPGANTQGRTLPEARRNLKEAIRLILETNRELAEERNVGRDVIKEECLVGSE